MNEHKNMSDHEIACMAYDLGYQTATINAAKIYADSRIKGQRVGRIKGFIVTSAVAWLVYDIWKKTKITITNVKNEEKTEESE